MRYQNITNIEFKKVKISNVDYKSAYNMVTNAIVNKEPGYVCLNDVCNVIVASKDDDMRAAVNASLLSLPDGMPLVWFAKMVGCKKIERISGGYFLKQMIVDMAGYRHFLLGDTVQTINRVIDEAKRLSSNIEITGYSPPFKVFDDEDNRIMIEKINEAEPDIIWVSFGGQKQEKWMNQNYTRVNRGVMIGVGAAFRYFIGDIMTPPQLIQSLGLQWVFRLVPPLLENPRKWMRDVRERELLVNKFIFLANLPTQVLTARRHLKMTHNVSA